MLSVVLQKFHSCAHKQYENPHYVTILGRLGIIERLQTRKDGNGILQVCATPLKYCVLSWLCYHHKEHRGMEEWLVKEKDY